MKHESAKPISRVPAALRAGLSDYADRVGSIAGDALVSLSVFGVVLTPDWRPTRPVHQALVLATADLDLIARLGGLARGATPLGLSAPLLLTPGLVTSSLDAFPLEWLEISDRHEVLRGEDLFRDLVFTPEHLRLQCERECLVLGIALRQRLVQGPEAISMPLVDAAEQAIRVLRGLLHLAGRELPSAPTAIIAAASQLIGFDPAPLARAWDGETGATLLAALHGVVVAIGERSDGA